ncbi:MAG: iron ABC transporter permease, partial [Candidatus Dormibacteraeota bacterium]|nr:iron ABC transporter permease [Candidatus Dormibacteraeota bacterium]
MVPTRRLVSARWRSRPEASSLLFFVAVLVLGFMVLVPISWLVLSSFQDPVTQHLTFDNYRSAFSKPYLRDPIINSFKMAFAVGFIAVAVGTPLAWLVSRTDVPGRSLLRPLILAGFVTPSFLGANAWIFLAAPNSGMVNNWIRDLFH